MTSFGWRGDADDARRVLTVGHPTNMWMECHPFTLCMIKVWLVMSPPWRDTSKVSCCMAGCRVPGM